jgi:hypothetical protein
LKSNEQRKEAAREISELLIRAENLIGEQYKKEKEAYAELATHQSILSTEGKETANAIKFLREASSLTQTARYRADDAAFYNTY